MLSGSELACIACKGPMVAREEVPYPGQGPKLEVYECADEACHRKAVILFEPGGGLSDEERGWVEREVARRGAFFPSDFRGPQGSRFGR
jgi:hypothetical protein